MPVEDDLGFVLHVIWHFGKTVRSRPSLAPHVRRRLENIVRQLHLGCQMSDDTNGQSQTRFNKYRWTDLHESRVVHDLTDEGCLVCFRIISNALYASPYWHRLACARRTLPECRIWSKAHNMYYCLPAYCCAIVATCPVVGDVQVSVPCLDVPGAMPCVGHHTCHRVTVP